MLLQAPDSVPGNRSASRSASSVRDTPARRALDVRDRRQGSPRRDIYCRSRVEAILGNMSYHSVTRPNSCHVRISLISGTSSNSLRFCFSNQTGQVGKNLSIFAAKLHGTTQGRDSNCLIRIRWVGSKTAVWLLAPSGLWPFDLCTLLFQINPTTLFISKLTLHRCTLMHRNP